MLKIGLTGGIGSGKTTIANIFSTLGVPVYDADKAAKMLMQANPLIKEQITAQFGREAYKDGALNRSFLASVVFNNDEKLKQINNIIHPITIQDSVNWFNTLQEPYAIKEAAIIFETGSEEHLDYVIGVWAPEALRIERTMHRGNVTSQQVKERMKKQMNEEEKMKRCDFLINNDGSQPIIPQVFELHKKLEQLALTNKS